MFVVLPDTFMPVSVTPSRVMFTAGAKSAVIVAVTPDCARNVTIPDFEPPRKVPYDPPARTIVSPPCADANTEPKFDGDACNVAAEATRGAHRTATTNSRTKTRRERGRMATRPLRHTIGDKRHGSFVWFWPARAMDDIEARMPCRAWPWATYRHL
jgi:hypothetical protein